MVLVFFNIQNTFAQNNSLFNLGQELIAITKSENPDKIVDLMAPDLDIDTKAAILESFLSVKDNLYSINSNKEMELFNVVKQGNFVYFIVKSGKRFFIIKGKANEQNQITDHFALLQGKTADMLKLGQRVYKMRCYSCHGENGKGSIGPNLTDKYWKYVNSEGDLYNAIAKGKKGTMMMAYKDYLSPEELKAVTLYIKSLQGKKIKSGKKPEGEEKEIPFKIINN